MADTSKITLGQLKTALTQAKNYTDNEIAGVAGISKVEPETSDMPKVFFNGDKPTNKTSVYATIEYISKTEHFKGYVDIKCQGTSSMAYPKKNYTIKMFTDETMAVKLKKDFRGWGKQSKFCLKANYIDHSHARNIISAKLWDEIVASRTNYTELPELLRTSPCNGAIDGFPIKVYYNNTYEGVYTWNIPKDKWMFNMDDALDNHCVLCGEEYVSGCFRSANASLWSDEIHDVMPESIKTSFNNFINFVMNSTDDEFKTNLENYVYVDSLIDYYIFQYVICGLDSMGKNQLFATYDGIKWIATSYDMDSTFGLYWNGQRFVSAEYRMQEDYESMTNGRQGNLLYIRLEQSFCNEIKARYAELRANILSYSNIVREFEQFMDVIGKDLFAEDLTIYTAIPSGNTNNIQQIRNYTRDRLTYVDAQIEALRELVPCTGIVLSVDTLSFTTTDTQTITATVQPTNTTDVVTWSASPTGVVTVDNGVVTPIANGDCTITATCGSMSATCSVNVALPTVACTSISLDKNALTLGNTSDSSENVNLLSGVNSTISENVIFDAITLEAGGYEICNINGGTFTWLGYTINGKKLEPNRNSTDSVTFRITETTNVIISAFPNNSAANTADKLALYKYILTSPQQFTQSGTGYFDKGSGNIIASSNDVYSETISLNSAKQYMLVNNGLNTIHSGHLCIKFNNTVGINDSDVTSGQVIKTIKNTSTIAISINTGSGSLSDIQLIEMEKAGGTTSTISTKLTAIVTPDNCTQPVVWSVSPQGIVTVDNGLVTAVTNGEATVTATCGTQSATCAVTVSGITEIENQALVFKIDSTCMDTSANTLTDKISGISATLTGNPTVSNGQIVFTTSDKFKFDISSLNLTSSNRTFRIKFTPTTLDSSNRNVIIIGSNGASWNHTTSAYINNERLILQHGRDGFTNHTVGSPIDNYVGNRLSTAPVTGQEYELVISENIDGNIRWYIDGILVQDGTTALSNPLYISNIEGSSRFIGSYSLIEVYNEYCNDYTEFTNMINN